MQELKYGFIKTIRNTTFDAAIARVTEALQSEGFGVLTRIDVQATFKKKLDVDFRPYIILGACNPVLAHTALNSDAHIGLLLPCNVVVQQMSADGVEISIVDPKAMFMVVDKPDLIPVAEQVYERIRRVVDKL